MIAPFAFDFTPRGRRGPARRLQRRQPGGGGGDPRRGARPPGSPDGRRLPGRPRRALARLGGGGDAGARRRWRRSAAGASRLSDMAAELAPPEGAPADEAGRGRRRSSTPALPGRLPAGDGGAAGGRRRAPARRRRRRGSRRRSRVDGNVRLAGPVTDATSRRRDPELRRGALRPRPGDRHDGDRRRRCPSGWPGRVLAGVEALAALEEGRVGGDARAAWRWRAGASTPDVERQGRGAARRQGRRGGGGRRRLQRRGGRRGARRRRGRGPRSAPTRSAPSSTPGRSSSPPARPTSCRRAAG